MYNIAKLLIPLVFLGMPLLCYSQEKYDYKSVAGNEIPVFRGELAEKYNYRFDGTVYAWSDEFETGDLEFNGKWYYGLTMNLNAHRNELQVRIGNSGENMSLKRSLVGDFTIGKRNCTALFGERKIKGLPEGYYQVLYRGKDMLLKQIYKNVTERVDFATHVPVKVFTTRTRYWLARGEKVTVIRGEKDLAGIYKERKGDIKKYIKEHKGKGGEKDDMLVSIMSLVEQKH